MAFRQCMLAMELEEIEREKVVAKCQIRQYFPVNKLCYMICITVETDFNLAL